MQAQVASERELENMISLENLGECAHFQVPMARYTSFRIGGIARVVFTPRDETELERSLCFCRKYQLQPSILGGGSNLLIVRDVLPAVISLRKLKAIAFHGDAVYAAAGTPLLHLVRQTAKRGLQGLEVLNGIPGTVGGALAGNAGGNWEGRRVDIGDFVREVKVLDNDAGILSLPQSAIEFGYRWSSLSKYVIVGAVFQLRPAPASDLQMRCKVVFDKKKQTQPLDVRSAGCIFKNPPGVPAW